MRHRFRTSQWLPYPLERVFAFFADPANLPRLLPPWQRARLDAIELHPAAGNPGLSSTAAGSGTRVTLSFRPTPLAPIRVSWDALIENFHWNHRYCDRQIRGPFLYWRHCHRMQAHESERTGEPGTLLVDTVEYDLPFGTLGRVANRVAVERLIASVFRYRHRRAAELLRELSEGAESRA